LIVSPSFGKESSTVFVTARSASCTLMSAESESFAGLLSAWSDAVSVAVLPIVVPPVPTSTVAVIVSVSDAEAAMLARLQTPVPLEYVPCVAELETNVTPLGSTSVTSTFVAASGPPLSSTTV